MKILKSLVLLIATITCFSFSGNSQKQNITGIVVDSTNNPQPWATAAILQLKDSALVNYSLSNREGKFAIIGVDTGSYILQVTFAGMGTYSENIRLAEQGKDLDVGTILLSEDMLKEVRVESDFIPIRIKADTVEFNANAYKADPNASVEEILKKMPGFEIDADGNLTVNGEKVGKVMVDGKEFFGGDGKVAIQNLPADAVDKVQVYDKKSEKAQFTGVDDGERTKTVDLKLKKDKKKGAFGSVMAGYGVDENMESVYNSKLNWNKFDKKLQLSFIGTFNNINQTGFSYQEFIDFVGGMQKFSQKVGNGWRWNGNTGGLPISNGLGQGRAVTASGGVNFNYAFKKKTELNVSYLIYRIDNLTESTSMRQNFIAGGSFLTQDSDLQEVLNLNHKMSLRFDHAIDTATEITIMANGGYSVGNMHSLAESYTYGTESELQNSSIREYFTDQDAFNFNSEFNIKRKMKKKGRSLFAEGSFGMDGTDNRMLLDGLNQLLYGSTLVDIPIIQNQKNLNNEMTYDAEVAYTEPLKNDNFLEFTAGMTNFTGLVDYQVYNVYPDSAVVFNDMLSNKYVPGFLTYYGGGSYMRVRTAYTLTAGLEYQYASLDGELQLMDTSISKQFHNFLPSAELNLNLKQGKRIMMEFSTRADAPALEQVQPVVDNSNPTSIYTGNPNLGQEYTYEFNVNYNGFNPVKMGGWFGGVYAEYTTNNIVNATTVDENLIRYTTPVNVRYATNTFFYLNRSSELKFLNSRFSLGMNGNFNRGIIFLNNLENENSSWFAGLDLRVMNKKTKVVDLLVNLKANYNSVSYSISKEFNQDYMTYYGFVDLSVKFAKNWLWKLDFDYTLLSAEVYGEATSIPLLSTALSYFVLDNRGEIKLYAFDIFNQNQSITRSVNLNYIDETTRNIIQRYYMLSFTWNLAGKRPKGSDGGGHWRMWRR
jgi:hypothetical protein